MKTTRFLPAVAATLITAGALAAPSLAQDSGTDESTSTESTDSAEDTDREAAMADREAAKAERQARYNELLAGELDVTVDDLVAARDSVKTTMKAEARVMLEAKLDEKVAAGDITQDQADEILAKFDDGELRGRRGGGHGDRGGRGGHGPRGGGGNADAGTDTASADATAA